MLEVGSKAPDFCAQNQDDVKVCLKDFKQKWLVLYFYPKDLTPGCTTQACDFTAKQSEFKGLNATIVGVSPDDIQKHKKFIEKKDLTLTLLSDSDNKICKDYNVWQLKNFMGKSYMGVVRTTFIINPEGIICALWSKVKVKDHAEIVKEKLKELQNQ